MKNANLVKKENMICISRIHDLPLAGKSILSILTHCWHVFCVVNWHIKILKI